jgi:hypothetical protein
MDEFDVLRVCEFEEKAGWNGRIARTKEKKSRSSRVDIAQQGVQIVTLSFTFMQVGTHSDADPLDGPGS